MLPLLVVMAMVLLVFKVRADEQDARAGIPVTVLLTLVFLQQTYRDELPDLPFLTFLDQVYVVAYVVTLLAFVLVIYIGRRYGEMEEMPEGPRRDQIEQRLHRLDEIWPLTVVVFSSISIVLCWFTLPPGG
jgi:Ca2+/Na+ antiporter